MTFKNMNTPLLTFSAFILLAFSISCNNADTTPDISDITDVENTEAKLLMPAIAVKPPLPDIEVPFITYIVPVKEGMTFETPTGTTVKIPADAFVDKDGKPVEGKVDIKFREFHDASDIIVSGIPMHDPETGEYMETGGMFEIAGEQNGQEIFVKADKDIKINLASYNKGDDFNFFELDKKKCHWDDEGRMEKEKPNAKRAKALAELEKSMPLKPVKPAKKSLKDDRQYFELDVNYSKFPTLAAFSDVIWQYSGQGVDIEKEKWVFESNWDNISIHESETGYFELKLSNDKKTISTFVQPVLAGKDYEKSLAEFTEKSMKEYEKIKEEVRLKRERLNYQAEMQRALSISGFGTFNCDRWKSLPNINCNAEFTFDELAGVSDDILKEIKFYLVMKNRKGVIPYTTRGFYKFFIPKDGDNALLAVIPGGKVALFTNEDFKNLDFDKIKKTNSAVIDMRTTDNRVESREDLSMILDFAMAN